MPWRTRPAYGAITKLPPPQGTGPPRAAPPPPGDGSAAGEQLVPADRPPGHPPAGGRVDHGRDVSGPELAGAHVAHSDIPGAPGASVVLTLGGPYLNVFRYA